MADLVLDGCGQVYFFGDRLQSETATTRLNAPATYNQISRTRLFELIGGIDVLSHRFQSLVATTPALCIGITEQ